MKSNYRFPAVLFLLFLIVSSGGFAQKSEPNNDEVDFNKPSFNSQETNQDSLALWQERIVLHIANKHVSNDFIFFKAYFLSGVKQNRLSFSGVLNLEFLDVKGNMIKRQFHKIADGMVEGQLQLPKNTPHGKYYLKAYTRWMRNYGDNYFAQEEITIGKPLSTQEKTKIVSNNIIIPEGGTILANHENRLIIKIPLFEATKIGQVGRILDDLRKEVATVNYYSSGIGTAVFKPIENKLYQLELENEAMYPIPKAELQGYLLHVNNIDQENAKIRVTASPGVRGNTVKLIGTSNGIKHFEKQLNFKDSNVKAIDLSKKDIPHGVFTLQLIDDVGTELARRPILIDGERLHINIQPLSSDAAETVYKIKVTDKTNAPIKTQLTIGVNRYNEGTEKSMEERSNYLPVLFLYSEIGSEDKFVTNRKNHFLRDLNILVSDVGVEKTLSEVNHIQKNVKSNIQKGLELSGHTYDLDNKLLKNTKIQVMVQNEEEHWIKEKQTDANGLLILNNTNTWKFKNGSQNKREGY